MIFGGSMKFSKFLLALYIAGLLGTAAYAADHQDPSQARQKRQHVDDSDDEATTEERPATDRPLAKRRRLAIAPAVATAPRAQHPMIMALGQFAGFCRNTAARVVAYFRPQPPQEPAHPTRKHRHSSGSEESDDEAPPAHRQKTTHAPQPPQEEIPAAAPLVPPQEPSRQATPIPDATAATAMDTTPDQPLAAVDFAPAAPVEPLAPPIPFTPYNFANPFSTTATAHLASTLSSCLDANELTKKIAKTWIRNASEYIFHDNSRSFLELVVNACDTTVEATGHPENVVGKFGMGFYSIFSFLDLPETAGTRIILSTCFAPSLGIREGYTLTFLKDPEHGIHIGYEKMLVAPAATGTTLEIRPNTGTFTEPMLARLRHYVHYLDFYPHVTTRLSYNDAQELVGGSPEAPTIEVILQPDVLCVRDAGNGISTDCAFSTLLIPSSSSKRRSDLNELRRIACERPSTPLQLVCWQGKENTASSHFIITVNGVIVIDRMLARPIKDPSTHASLDLVLAMPQATQLTLARNELSITPDGLSFEEAMIKKIIDETLSSVLLHDGITMLLTAFYSGLQQWETQTAAHHIRTYAS